MLHNKGMLLRILAMHEPKKQPKMSIFWMFCLIILLIHNFQKSEHRVFDKGSIDEEGAVTLKKHPFQFQHRH